MSGNIMMIDEQDDVRDSNEYLLFYIIQSQRGIM
jgi:hypothetical protein